ncbi:nucleotidyltransferase domain-containing protein [Aeromonas popoffii]|uniref:nucleotidyltransferase domain-containing protein n=1 Tax=Aeromonas popoffii TaxID=70856 RepID=UPI000A6244E3|nr:nucleotidyltransferase domain-containing protein [Aeromonas popoffii]
MTRSDDQMDLLAIPPLQRTLVQAVVACFEPRVEVLAAVVIGSLAKGKADRVSDVDVLFMVEPGFHRDGQPCIDRFLAGREVFHCWQGAHGNEGYYWRYIFYDFTSIEIHLIDVNAEFPLARPYLPLFDKTSCIRALEVDGPAPSHWDFPAYMAEGDGLVWELFDCLKWAERGQRGLVRHHLRKLLAEMDKDPDIVDRA